MMHLQSLCDVLVWKCHIKNSLLTFNCTMVRWEKSIDINSAVMGLRKGYALTKVSSSPHMPGLSMLVQYASNSSPRKPSNSSLLSLHLSHQVKCSS